MEREFEGFGKIDGSRSFLEDIQLPTCSQLPAYAWTASGAWSSHLGRAMRRMAWFCESARYTHPSFSANTSPLGNEKLAANAGPSKPGPLFSVPARRTDVPSLGSTVHKLCELAQVTISVPWGVHATSLGLNCGMGTMVSIFTGSNAG
jgi:hypothetical protein